ncbi:hypothetical protein [Thauera phenylacetica]
MKETVSEWTWVLLCSGRLQFILGLGTASAGVLWILYWILIVKHAGTSDPMMAGVIGALKPYHWVPPLLVMIQTIGLVFKNYERERRRLMRW